VQVNYVLNTLLSLHMVVAFLVAVILDNTVPGSQQERGVYVWSETDAARREPAVTKDYELPFRVGRVFRWVKWVGLWGAGKLFWSEVVGHCHAEFIIREWLYCFVILKLSPLGSCGIKYHSEIWFSCTVRLIGTLGLIEIFLYISGSRAISLCCNFSS
jgi:hypothetical protein